MRLSEFPKITVVTPNYNLGEYLEETILSVVSQHYPNLEYIIIDGGSSDNSIDIIKKYEKHLAWCVSEGDNGMYDAIDKGFRRSTGDIMLWLNSDDILFQKSLFSVAKIFHDLPEVNWIQGMKSKIDLNGIPLEIQSSHPRSYYSLFINDYKWIPQESVAWRRSLYEKAGNQMNKAYNYAGDFELWTRFLKSEDLFFAPVLIGGFRNRKGQLSKERSTDNISKYEAEVNEILSNLEKPKDLKKVIIMNNWLLRIANWLPSYFSKKILHKRLKELHYNNAIIHTGSNFKIKG